MTSCWKLSIILKCGIHGAWSTTSDQGGMQDCPTSEIMEALTKVSTNPLSGTVLTEVIFSKSDMI